MGGAYVSPLAVGLPDNPLLKHIDDKVAEMHPLAQNAINQGLGPTVETIKAHEAQASPVAAPVAGGVQPATATETATPAPLATPGRVAPIVPRGTSESPEQQARINELGRLEQTGSGVSQVHSPWARIPLQILDAIGSGFFPRVAAEIPGTTAHHGQLVNAAANAVNRGETVENEQQKRALAAEEAPVKEELERAQTENQRAEAGAHGQKMIPLKAGEGLYDPTKGAWQVEPTSEEGVTEIEPSVGQSLGLKPNKDGRYLLPKGGASLLKKPEPKEDDEPLGDARITELNAHLPKEYQLKPGATKGDYKRTEQLFSHGESEQDRKAAREQSRMQHEETMAATREARTEKQDTATKQAAFKAYAPAMDSAERFNVMAKNYEDATKNHDQQAMLSLLANHLGMTMGLQKGARLTKDIIREAEASRPWLQGMGAKFDKDGYLSGVTLTPQQMSQMLNLGRERFAEDVSKSGNEARYLGATDEGPERTPNKATITHYLGLAGGDVQKAKQLAKQDGWTVK